MPSDINGNYSLPSGYLAVEGETIQPSQHNPPLEDLAAAVSVRLPVNGSKGMTGPIKLVDGSAGSPAAQFGSATSTGIYKTTAGIGVAIGGAKVAEFGANGILLGAVPIGSGMDYWGTTAPAGWLFAYGQAVSRTTYAALFAVIGETYGAGDGVTTFNLPDKRGRASFGKDNMGGTSANRITDQSGGFDGDTLGDAGGSETHTLTEAEMPEHGHGSHTHLFQRDGTDVELGFTSVNLTGGPTPIGVVTVTGSAQDITIKSSSVSNAGSDNPHNNLPPGIVCNYIIFAGI